METKEGNSNYKDGSYCVAAELRTTKKRMAITGAMSHESAIARKHALNANSNMRKQYRFFHVAKHPYKTKSK